MKFLYILLVLLPLLLYLYLRRHSKKQVALFLSSSKRGVDKTPEDFRIPYELVYFDTSDGVELSGWFIESACDCEESFIICGDGFTTKSDLLPNTLFLRERYNLLYFDLRGTGNSKGVYMFGFEEHKDIYAAWRFLLDKREEFSKRVFIYTCGFTALSLTLSDSFKFDGIIIKHPYIDPMGEITKMLRARSKFIICLDDVYRFFPEERRRMFFDVKKLKSPTIIISSTDIETSQEVLRVTSDDEMKEKVFDFFRH